MFYDIFNSVCEDAGISPTKVLTDIGMHRSVFTNWKNGGEPSNETRKKIADYFSITVKQLMTGEIESPATQGIEADDELLELREEIRRNPDMKALFSLGKNATPYDLRKMIKVMKAMGEDDHE